MRKEITNTNGAGISYLVQNDNQGAIIFLLHGNSNSARIWYKQLDDPIFEDFCMIAFDLPGHGASVHMNDSAENFNVIAMASTLAEVIKKLAGSHPFILTALSLGTNIIEEMLALDLQSAGICLVSPTIVGKTIPPSAVTMPGAAAQVLYENYPETLLLNEFLEETTVINIPNERAMLLNDYKNVHPSFRSSLRESIIIYRYSDEIGTLQKFNHPVLYLRRAGKNYTTRSFSPNKNELLAK